MLTVAVLGPVVLRRDGVELTVPAGKTTELLVRLALEAGTPVRAERLIDDLWSGQVGDSARLTQVTQVARNTLQAKVSNLRRALGDRELLVGGSLGYTLVVDPAEVDALALPGLAEEAGSLRATGDAEAALAVSTRALQMFSAELLPGAGDGGWLEPHRARLEAIRVRLREDALAARVDLGRTGDLLADLESAVTEHPLREGFWRLLMIALYRAGRQADALAAYRRVRQVLDDELGLEPGPDLQSLEQQILRQDDVLAPTRQRGPALVRGNLPATSSSLVGRGTELAELGDLLAAERLVTITGPAGVGKTRLAVELAGRATPSGGSWLVRLESARTLAAFWQVVGETFGLTEAGEAMVLERLRGDDVLVVLDNCEQLVDVLPGPVGRLLAAPGVRLLATSQLPLGVDGEVVQPLEPLPVADSVTLFAERAAGRRRSFVLDDDTGRVIEAVCRSLDGLPLAIELAAARAKALSVQEIAKRLDDRFTLLNDPTGRRPARHRTLAAAISWSYDLLFPDDQRGLWALACFAGGAPLPAVEHVLVALDVPLSVCIDVLDRLVDRSLVGVEVTDGAVRYRLLDSVRAFSSDKLDDSGLADVAHGAHAHWLASAADGARTASRGPDQAGHLGLLRVERANVDAALAWTAVHDPAVGTRIALGFGWPWAILGAGADGARRIRTALAADPGAADQDRAAGLFLASWLEAAGGDLDRAAADVEQALAIGGPDAAAAGQVYLAFVRTQQGRPQDVLDLVAGARPELTAGGQAWEAGASWLLTAWAATAVGDMAGAQAACDQAITALTPLGDRWALIHADALLGGLAQAGHRFAVAITHHARAAAAADELGFAAAAALHLANLGRAEHQAGDLAAATVTLERAIEAGIATGDLRLTALARVRLGRVLRASDSPDQARAVLESAARWYVSAGGGEGEGLAGLLLAALDGDVEVLRAVLDSARGVGDAEVELLTLDALAAVLAEQGSAAESSALLATADALLPRVRHLVTDADRIDAIRARALTPGGAGRVAPPGAER